MLVAGPTTARELWQSGPASLDGGGSVRQILVVSRGTNLEDFYTGYLTPSCEDDFANCPAFDAVGEQRVVTSLTRLRLRGELRIGEHLSAVAEFDNELIAGHLDTFEAQLGQTIASRTWVDAGGSIGNDRVEYRYFLWRGYVKFDSRHFTAIVGRQRVPWGVGRLWSPMDRFNAIRPLAIQGDQFPAVDAALGRILIGDFTEIEGVFSAADVAENHSGAARLHGVLLDVDYSLMAGVFDDAPAVGFDLATNLGGAAGRAEVVFTHPRRLVWPIGEAAPRQLDDFWQLVVSVDYSFDIGDGLYALLEYLYNGNAQGFGYGKAGNWLTFFEEPVNQPLLPFTSPNRFGGSRVISGSHHLTALQLGYDLTPELRIDFLTIADWDGPSVVFYPALRWSPLDWLELTVGVQGTAGPHLSEYGSLPTTAFLLADFFF
ncbi:MAG: hypothetical protein JRH17_10535 [Deltaproteobacteria bacterium]|nr:hypothetical protein [Deltaproteobacteria bacterium]